MCMQQKKPFEGLLLLYLFCVVHRTTKILDIYMRIYRIGDIDN
jgi:hypothetical protein